jgi:glycosyltransferase involved in cell wall biosynthesis
VHVVTSRQRYDDPSVRLAREETVQGVRVHRVWTTHFGRSRLAGRAIDYLTFYLSAAWRLNALLRAGDVAIAKTDPPLISVPAHWVARRRGARLINWLQDLFPEAAERLGVRLARGALGSAARALRDRSLRAAAMNVVPGEGMARALIGNGSVASERIAVVHNWADGRLIRPLPHRDNSLRNEWGLADRFVVGYSGNMGRAHEFATVIDAAERLRGARDVMFLFVGGGKHEAWLRDEAARRGLGALFRFRPYQPRERLAESLCVADLHLVTLKPELEGLIVPSKFYGIAAAGRPTLFVGDPDGEIARILRAEDCGLSLRAGDAQGLAQAIVELKADAERRASMGSNARRAFDARFDKPRAMAEWRAILERSLAAIPLRGA